MCGIVGAYDFRLQATELHERVRIATAQLAHRGPDDGDVISVCPVTASGATVVFGHRRLAIIDLSAAGHQPMRHDQTGDWITFNGEIYNFIELRRELISRGHSFRSQCDTEVLLASYAEWGVGCLRRLRGIFSFAIWDQRRELLLLARDHLGVKPLYYFQDENCLWFGSETRSLLASGAIPRKLDSDGVASYLKYGSVQEPLTLVQGVRSLPAGGYLLMNMRGHSKIRNYWGPHECISCIKPRLSTEETIEHLKSAVNLQMVADVPVGIFLSSGIDSAIIATLAARSRTGNIRTFCVGFADEARDERASAKAIADKIGCSHTDLFLDGTEVCRELPEMLRRSDLPSSDGMNTYYISKAVRDAGMKVALSGLGGDELFGGYGGFAKQRRMEWLSERVRMAPTWLNASLGGFLAEIVPTGSARAGAITEMLSKPHQDSYFSSRVMFSQAHILRMLSLDLKNQGSEWRQREQQLIRRAKDLDQLTKFSYLELQTYLVSTLLRDADQMSMCHGLEVRVPLIDHVLVEGVLPLDANVKMLHGKPKALLLQALGHKLEPTSKHPAKRGFELPIENWIRGEMRASVEPYFMSEGSGIWRPGTLPKLWRGFVADRISWSRLWTVFMLESWLRQHRINP